MIMSQSMGLGIIVRGLRGDDLKALKAISDKSFYGTLDGFDKSGGIAIGSRLANSLNASIGSEITLLTMAAASTPFGKTPLTKRFTVKAIFEAGQAEYDNTAVFLPLKDAQALFKQPGAVHVLEVELDHPENADAIHPSLQAAAGDGMLVTDWLQRAREASERALELAQHADKYEAKLEALSGHLIVRPFVRRFDDFEQTAARLKAVPGVKLAIPVVEGQAMAASQKDSAGIIARGLRGHDLKALPAISGNVRSGTLDGFDKSGGIAVGTGLAKALNASVGSEIALAGPHVSMPGGTVPRVKRFKVKAVFETGLPAYDSTMVFIPLKEAQSFFNVPGAAHVLLLYVDNPENAGAMRPSLQAAAGDDMIMSDMRQRKAAAAKTWSKE